MARKRDTTNYQQGDEGDVRFWLPPDLNGKPAVLTAARKRRGDVVTAEGDRGGVERRSIDRPLEYYIAKAQITGTQYRAGLRLHELWAKGSQSPFSQAKYEDGSGGGQRLSFVPTGFAAVEFRLAMAAVPGNNRRDVVYAVCCQDIPASRSMRFSSRRTAERLSMAWLRDGLDSLAKHLQYGVE